MLKVMKVAKSSNQSWPLPGGPPTKLSSQPRAEIFSAQPDLGAGVRNQPTTQVLPELRVSVDGRLQLRQRQRCSIPSSATAATAATTDHQLSILQPGYITCVLCLQLWNLDNRKECLRFLRLGCSTAAKDMHALWRGRGFKSDLVLALYLHL